MANSVKFGSLNEVVGFIDNIVNERPERKFRDRDILDKDVEVEDCFAKVILTCGFNWIPDEEEMDIIWKMLNNLDQEDINRIYYKNNLYEFVRLPKIKKLLFKIIDETELFLDPNKPPKDVLPDLELLWSMIEEWVVYNYFAFNRIGRLTCDKRDTVCTID